MKNRLVCLVSSILFVALLVTGCGGATGTQQAASQTEAIELNISAAVSMKDALAEIQANYQAKHPNVKILYNLGASGSLQQQIEQGAPADIFISAAPKQMNELEAENLINKATRRNLVENKLVLIVPKNSTLAIDKFEDLAQTSVQKWSMGEPSVVPAGQYSQEVLKKLGIWNDVKAKAVLAKDVRTVLAYVETGNVEAGIVYKTDAASSDKVKIVATASEGMHQPILYPIAILSATKQAKTAEDFLTYLTSSESAAIFEKYGFVMSKNDGK